VDNSTLLLRRGGGLVEPASATVWIGPNSAEGQSADFVIAK
jgi:hypothetical protein